MTSLHQILFGCIFLISHLVENCDAVTAGVRWNKRISEFETISGFSSYETAKKRLVMRSRDEETHNFGEKPLRISYYEDPGFVHFHDNDTRISGICGDIWTSLSRLSNFTMVLKRWEEGSLGIASDNGTVSGILENARINETDVIPKLQAHESRTVAVDFTPAFWMNGQRIFSFAQWKRDQTWMVKLFTVKVWLLVIVTTIILSFASVTMEIVVNRYDIRTSESRSTSYHFFNTFAMLCNQGEIIIGNKRPGFRILLITIVTFSWLILTSYSSCLIYNVTRETLDPPFDDLETLLELTKIRVVILNGSLGHLTFFDSFSESIFNRLVRAKRVAIASNVTELRLKACASSGQYAFFSAIDDVLGLGKTLCKLVPVGTTYHRSPTASGIARTVGNKKTLDVGIMKLREFGLIDALKKRYIDYHVENDNGVRRTDSLAIEVDQILLILILFLIGVVASLIICVAENIFASWNYEKKRTK